MIYFPKRKSRSVLSGFIYIVGIRRRKKGDSWYRSKARQRSASCVKLSRTMVSDKLTQIQEETTIAITSTSTEASTKMYDNEVGISDVASKCLWQFIPTKY